MAALRKQATAHEDLFCTTHLAFMAGPTLHSWTVDASWFTVSLSDVHCLQPDTDTEHEGRPDGEAVQQLATMLAVLLAFRIAPRHRRLKIAASTLTAQHGGESVSADTVRWAADLAARQDAAEDIFQDVEDNQLPRLAAELARNPDYVRATKADVRRHRAQQCERSMGRCAAWGRASWPAGCSVPCPEPSSGRRRRRRECRLPEEHAGAGASEIGGPRAARWHNENDRRARARCSTREPTMPTQEVTDAGRTDDDGNP
ncbi:hypothetical protein [Streptomyces scopuliridis]|uniref:hypothetical protein n=1 Tax=Streptomyces scopuliridis TaxID=452529 RepID=UPI00367E5DF8